MAGRGPCRRWEGSRIQSTRGGITLKGERSLFLRLKGHDWGSRKVCGYGRRKMRGGLFEIFYFLLEVGGMVAY